MPFENELKQNNKSSYYGLISNGLSDVNRENNYKKDLPDKSQLLAQLKNDEFLHRLSLIPSSLSSVDSSLSFSQSTKVPESSIFHSKNFNGLNSDSNHSLNTSSIEFLPYLRQIR